MPFTEDLSQFLATGDFGTAATYKLLGVGAGSTVNVVFDEPEQDHMGITGTRPRATGRASDFASFSSTDTLTIGGTVYRVKECNPIDDGAMVELVLEDQT